MYVYIISYIIYKYVWIMMVFIIYLYINIHYLHIFINYQQGPKHPETSAERLHIELRCKWSLLKNTGYQKGVAM